jgi:hypothetical protein
MFKYDKHRSTLAIDYDKFIKKIVKLKSDIEKRPG